MPVKSTKVQLITLILTPTRLKFVFREETMHRIKRILFVTTIVLSIVTSSLFSSDFGKTFYVGAEGGINWSKLVLGSSVFSSVPTDKPVANFDGGIIAGFTTGNWGFESGLRYAQSGAKTENFVGTSETGTVQGDFWTSNNVSVLEIPMHVSWHLNSVMLRPYLFAGPNVRYVLKAEEQLDANYDLRDWNQDIQSQLNSWQLSFQTGMGIRHAISRHFDVGLSASMLFGVTDYTKDDNKGEDKLRDVRVLGGIYYNIF